VSRRKQQKAVEQWAKEMREFAAEDTRQLAVDLGAGVPMSCPVTDRQVGVVDVIQELRLAAGDLSPVRGAGRLGGVAHELDHRT
jgi:hypothetical protein